MAWPCITRACCINRFWTELDKADIAVPLVFTKYSDVADAQHHAHQPQPKQRTGAIAIETQPPLGDQEVKAPPATGAAAGKDGSASVMRQDFKAWKVRPEPSCKPKNEYQPSVAPFINETQYQKDYKPWPIPKKGDHPWIPKPSPGGSTVREGDTGTKQEHTAAEEESGVEKSEIEEKVQEKESKQSAKKALKKEKPVEKKAIGKTEEPVSVERKGRAAADALNRQIKEEVSSGSSYRTEFKAYKDAKPAKPIKAPSQYKLPVEESNLETSYSATFKGEQTKELPADNKVQERRRIRSLYSEPGKESPKVDKPVTRSKPKKTPTTVSKTAKRAKEKQFVSSQSAKKKPSSSTLEPKPEGGVTKKSKEISNRLAEAKH